MALSLVILLALCSKSLSQPPNPLTLAETLFPINNPPNEAAIAVFPASAVVSEAPIQIRYTLMATLARYTVRAACHPTALNFLGKRDHVPRKWCNEDSLSVLYSYLLRRLLASQFKHEASAYAAFLIRKGLKPFDSSRDKNTEAGWANMVADDLVRFFESDGWNSQGDAMREFFRRPYEDSTGYEPKNRPGKISLPLRWTPLVDSDGKGYSSIQRHVTPHLGINVQPLVLSAKEFRKRRVKSPFKMADGRKISKEDMKTAKKLVRDMLKLNAEVDETKVAKSQWWDNKFFSIASFRGYYQAALKLTNEQETFIAMGEVLALHDSILLAWKEKRRHDLVRPETLLQTIFRGTVRAFRGSESGVGEIKVEEWRSAARTQPHSEFPSATAVQCEAAFTHLQMALQDMNESVVPYVSVIPPLLPPGSLIAKAVPVRFESLREAVADCGMSRLWSGVHFEPAVREGYALANGVGEAARLHMRDLIAGKVPQVCARCMKTTRQG